MQSLITRLRGSRFPRPLYSLGLAVIAAGTLSYYRPTGCSAAAFEQYDMVTRTVVNKTTVRIRIDRPDVLKRETRYTHIRFHPGDHITIKAGGCVQTGGFGATWKSYVNPQGANSDRLYHGLIWIPGATGGDLQRIGGFIGKTISVPNGYPASKLDDLYLRLGYEDDNYGDNGYWGHDDGNNDQCKGVGAAWVEITVQADAGAPPAASVGGPFDVVWDAVDENLIPLNPKWRWQLSHPGQVPTAKDFCNGHPFDHPCTTQEPQFDFPDFWTLAYSTCRETSDGLIPGHANWQPATFEGAISWEGKSASVFGDDDYNMRVKRDDKAGLTTLNDGTLGLEFYARETIDHFVSPWWNSFHNAVDDSDDAAAAMINGKYAIVTGLMGMDGVHGGYTESHPVYALAIRVKDDGQGETWAFMVRNWGTEGWCSQDTHFLDLADGTYTFRLPWRAGAKSFTVQPDSTFYRNESSIQPPSFGHEANKYVFVSFRLPRPEDEPRVHGEIHLKWNDGGTAHKAAAPTVGRPAGKKRAHTLEEHLAVKQTGDGDADLLDLALKMTPAQRKTLSDAVGTGLTHPELVRKIVPDSAALQASLMSVERRSHAPADARNATVPHERAAFDKNLALENVALRQQVEKAFGGKVPGIRETLPKIPLNLKPGELPK